MKEHKLNDKFNPKDFEEKIYKNGEEKEYFKPSEDRTKEPYTIVMPPPNITGKLHMGHALDETLQDVLIRYKRMKGYNCLWIPGTDHAAIATELKIVEKLRQEGIDKKDLTREEFLDTVAILVFLARLKTPRSSSVNSFIILSTACA